ncbi:hypothetical protein Sjap_012717 [Stephania japonica]|uniref:Uncharacterized protein n=1 Tax=Stephania japonica TaxID=461633 RepID=A0AAP0NZ72_9MAGN
MCYFCVICIGFRMGFSALSIMCLIWEKKREIEIYKPVIQTCLGSGIAVLDEITLYFLTPFSVDQKHVIAFKGREHVMNNENSC